MDTFGKCDTIPVWAIVLYNGKPEYRVHIKYAVSKNGIDWERENIVCIEPDNDWEVVVLSLIHI